MIQSESLRKYKDKLNELIIHDSKELEEYTQILDNEFLRYNNLFRDKINEYKTIYETELSERIIEYCMRTKGERVLMFEDKLILFDDDIESDIYNFARLHDKEPEDIHQIVEDKLLILDDELKKIIKEQTDKAHKDRTYKLDLVKNNLTDFDRELRNIIEEFTLIKGQKPELSLKIMTIMQEPDLYENNLSSQLKALNDILDLLNNIFNHLENIKRVDKCKINYSEDYTGDILIEKKHRKPDPPGERENNILSYNAKILFSVISEFMKLNFDVMTEPEPRFLNHYVYDFPVYGETLIINCNLYSLIIKNKKSNMTYTCLMNKYTIKDKTYKCIVNIIPEDNRINKFGLYSNYISAGVLIYKPFEYKAKFNYDHRYKNDLYVFIGELLTDIYPLEHLI